MAGLRIDESSALTRLAAWRSRPAGRPLAGVRCGDGAPWYFVTNEIVVDDREREVLDDLVGLGGTPIPEQDLPPPPLGLEPRRELDLDEVPRVVTVRFDRPPGVDVQAASEVLGDSRRLGDDVLVGSEFGALVAAACARHRARGRRVGLNIVGQPFAMPLENPQEGVTAAYPRSPLQWQDLAGSARIVDAWQLVDSVRQLRGGPAVFVAICDSGFWLDMAGRPAIAPGQPVSDFGSGVLQWNLVNEGSPVPGGTTGFHGNRVASAAAASVGNLAGAAGSGGTIATPAFFHTSYAWNEAVRAAKLCTWWGIQVLNFSWGFWGSTDGFEEDTWNATFDWAGANGLVVVAAAGNSDWNLPDDENVRPATRTPRTLTVGGLDATDNAVPGWAYGSSVNIWAPGKNIPVAPDGVFPAGSTRSGTSYAAPIVAGVAAMVRYCNPSLSADDVRQLLVDTGWRGSGHVSKGLDAYAAVWTALSHVLPDNDERNDTPATAYPLLPTGPAGLLQAGAGGFSGLADARDQDYWSFRLDRLMNVAVTIEWYERIASLHVRVVTAHGDDAGLDRSGSATSGRQVLTGLLSSGDYQVHVSGDGPTAYRLGVRLAGARLGPDQFEPNDSFDAAARLRFTAAANPWLQRREVQWGPGTFPATLHLEHAILGWSTVNDDYYRLDTPDAEILTDPAVWLSSADEPIDVVLFDAARQQLQSWPATWSITLKPPPSAVSYLKVSGAKQTRYTIGVGMRLREGALPGPLQKALPALPKWWGDPPPYTLGQGITEHAVEIGAEEQDDRSLAFAGVDGAALPEDLRLELVDGAGTITRTAAVSADGLVVDVTGIEAGVYIARWTVPGGAGPVAVQSAPPPLLA